MNMNPDYVIEYPVNERWWWTVGKYINYVTVFERLNTPRQNTGAEKATHPL